MFCITMCVSYVQVFIYHIIHFSENKVGTFLLLFFSGLKNSFLLLDCDPYTDLFSINIFKQNIYLIRATEHQQLITAIVFVYLLMLLLLQSNTLMSCSAFCFSCAIPISGNSYLLLLSLSVQFKNF